MLLILLYKVFNHNYLNLSLLDIPIVVFFLFSLFHFVTDFASLPFNGDKLTMMDILLSFCFHFQCFNSVDINWKVWDCVGSIDKGCPVAVRLMIWLATLLCGWDYHSLVHAEAIVSLGTLLSNITHKLWFYFLSFLCYNFITCN